LRAAVLQHGAAQPAALSAGLQLLTDSDLRAEATRITTPTLVISGQHDRVTPPGAGLALSRLIPGAAHVQIARAGHAPFVSHSAELLAALREFLATVRAT
jgi:pimeloyl-[acyl-carrier protein] methyl ester esterase